MFDGASSAGYHRSVQQRPSQFSILALFFIVTAIAGALAVMRLPIPLVIRIAFIQAILFSFYFAWWGLKRKRPSGLFVTVMFLVLFGMPVTRQAWDYVHVSSGVSAGPRLFIGGLILLGAVLAFIQAMLFARGPAKTPGSADE